MSYSAYPQQRGWARGQSRVPYAVASTLFFVFIVWYIFHTPAETAVQVLEKSSEPPVLHKTAMRPDAHLCNVDDAIGYTLPSSSRARCLDGSLPMFYHRKGQGEGKHKWVIYFEGGGWCYDINACKARTKTILGSSRDYPRCLSKDSMKHYISPLRAANPMMSSWNTVRIRYCDGGSYAGNAVVEVNNTKIYFRGQANRMETLRALLPLGLRNAQEVTLLGCSAGALGVYMGIDEMSEFIRREAAQPVTVRGLAVSGFFMEHTSNQTIDIAEALRHNSLKDDGLIDNRLDYATSMKRLFDMMNITSGTDEDCVRVHSAKHSKQPPSQCIFARHLLPHITTPVFTVQSQYDHWQVLHIYGRNYTDVAVTAYGHTLSSQLLRSTFSADRIALVRAGEAEAEAEADGRTGEAEEEARTGMHGVFIESCAHHCVSCSEANEDTWNGPKVRAVSIDKHMYSPGQAFKAWYAFTTNATVPIAAVSDLEGSLYLRASTDRKLAIYNNSNGNTLTTQYARFMAQNRLFVQNASYPCHACCSCGIR